MTLARRAVPLSIGCWGTRGKSGTERLKAALITGLGHGLVSKSSGCEAMFLLAHPFGQVREFLLYRPYDKATIWEHRDVVRMAAAQRASVFLWECMELTPAYVDVLQRQWSQDDLVTITNTFPDHEDLQGPAGWNVADVISIAVPMDARVITTERVMAPILKEQARRRNTEFRGVPFLSPGLITQDVQDRFPYQEHPENLDLVAAMGEELGCHRDFVIKEMADNMVPDLGVLKTYAAAPVKTRKIQFTNGQSANE